MCWRNLAYGAPLVTELFNYTNGSLVTVSAGLWTTHSGTAGETSVLAGRVELRSSQTEDVSVLIPGQPYPAANTNALYASFTLSCTSLPSAGGNYFLHLKGSALSNFRAKVFVLSGGAGAGQYFLGLAGNDNAPVVTNLVALQTNYEQRVYLRYLLSTGVATLWVNPDTENSPSVTAADATAVSSITSLALRQDTGIGVLSLDDLRVGTSFADVYAAPSLVAPGITQQPVNTAAIEGGAATFSVVATGSAPLRYQWKFNDIPLADGTNATLVLSGLTTNLAGQYSVTVTNLAGMANSTIAQLTVVTPNASGTLTVVHYNVKGNFAADWSTNAAQVQAIARELRYLNPDIIALNEIPNGFRYEMTNWMTAFFPTYQLVVSPGTDGSIRSGVISRYPITRSQSWLDGVSLTNFGYNGTYTRDLFEAEIVVPGATESLHLFSTHLKSAADPDSQQRRAAECSAVSNFFVNVFLPTNGWKPYLLTGDLNEDINLPMSQNLQAIQRLTNGTGLKLTTPLNPFTLTRYTHSIQGSLDARFDYVMPANVLASNIAASQVFRTDLLPPPLPLNLNSNDDIVASDHLPLVMVFNYPDPQLLVALGVSNQTVTLTWPALIGRKFAIQASTDLTTWTAVASNLIALTAQSTWTTSTTNAARFYRVVRTP